MSDFFIDVEKHHIKHDRLSLTVVFDVLLIQIHTFEVYLSFISYGISHISYSQCDQCMLLLTHL